MGLARVMGFAALLVTAQVPAPASSDDWPMFGRDHTNQHFSPLTQIDRATVKALRPAWIFQTGITGYFQAGARRGRDHALRLHHPEPRRRPRCPRRPGALDLHPPAAHGEDLRAALEPGRGGLGRPGLRGDDGRADHRPRRQDGNAALGPRSGAPRGGRVRNRLGAGGHARRQGRAGIEPARVQDAAPGGAGPRRRRGGGRRLRPARGGRQGRPRRGRRGRYRGRLRPARLARRLRRRHGGRALALVRHQGGWLGRGLRRDDARRRSAPPRHSGREGRRPGPPRGLARRGRLALDDARLRSGSRADLCRDRQPGAAEFSASPGPGTTSTP